MDSQGLPVMGFWRIGGLCCLVACAHAPEAPAAPSPSSAAAHYTVTIFDNFGGARVRACVEAASIRAWVPIDDSAARELSGAWVDGTALDTDDGRIPLSEGSRTSCVDYETRFGGSWFRPDDSSAVILSQTQWLWRPHPFPRELDVSIRFVLPHGAQASLPWTRADAVYFPDESAFFTEAYGVFGAFERQAFSVAGTSVEVARLGSRPPDDDTRRWLSRAVRTVASIGDRFPRDRLHFVVVPIDSPGEEVLFGMVRRGGGPSILLLPSSHATVAELETDWVAIHELSHLWMPRLRAEDRWLSEGIATYLQEVLRARCGLQSPDQAWRRLQEGFERGRRAGTGRDLGSESRNMNRTRAYHRVYWAGAAFALQADVRLREQSNGQTTLLDALSRAQHEWSTGARPVSASVFLRALDHVSGSELLKKRGKELAAKSDFPDTVYADSPEYRDIRAQIMATDDEACGVSGEPSR